VGCIRQACVEGRPLVSGEQPITEFEPGAVSFLRHGLKCGFWKGLPVSAERSSLRVEEEYAICDVGSSEGPGTKEPHYPLRETLLRASMKAFFLAVAFALFLMVTTAPTAWSQGMGAEAPTGQETRIPVGAGGGSAARGSVARPGSNAGSSGDILREHPEWYHTKGSYRPCPSSVTFPGGRNACLGCPGPCGFHF
jgi:hypothetical protein